MIWSVLADKSRRSTCRATLEIKNNSIISRATLEISADVAVISRAGHGS